MVILLTDTVQLKLSFRDNRGLAVGSVSAAVADRIEADEAKKSS